MVTSITKDGKEYSNPKDIHVPKETCQTIYKVFEK